MKLFNKRLFTATLMLILVGIAIAGIGYAMVSNKEGDTVVENQSYNIADVRSIQIDTDSPNVIITPVDGDQLNLSWQTDEYVEYQATLDGGVLSVSYRIASNWLKAIFVTPFADNEYILEVELPGGFQGDLAVNTVSGKIIADTAAALDACSLTSVSGVISAANIHSLGELALRSTSGEITAEALRADGDIRMQTVSGSVTAEHVNAGGALGVKTTSGKVELIQAAAKGGVTLDSVSGSLRMQDVSSATLFAKSVSGGIRPESVAAQSIELKSTSGSIKGSVAGSHGEYGISVSTVSGKSNLQNAAGSGGKTIKLSTVSGGIDLQFDDDN